MGYALHPSERWFEDWQVGDSLRSTRTYLMRQDRMIDFALEFDAQAFHTDPVAAADSTFGGLIASGWHTGSAMMSLVADQLGEASLGAFGVDELRWPHPVRVGDALRLTWTVLDKRRSESKPDRGIMRIRQELHSQHGDLVCSCIANMLIRARSTSD